MTGPALSVCHLVSGDAWGGAEAVVTDLVVGQSRTRGFEVSVLCLNEGRLSGRLRALGVDVRVIPEGDLGFWPLARRLDGVLRERRPRIVHSHRYKENTLSYLLARRCGARSVVTLHGYEPPERRLERLRLAVWRMGAYGLARIVGARFAAVSTDLRQVLSLSPARCRVIPNGVSIPEAAAVPEGSWRGPTIGWVGRLVPIKNLDLLLRVVAALSPDWPGLRLLLLGEGPERGRLERLARDLGIFDRVEFLGFVEDPGAAIEGMDLFALPSLHEGVPRAMLEAMARGLPVLAAAVGGIPEIAGAGEARLVAGHDVDRWTGALRELLEDRAAALAMGGQGRQVVQERYSVAAMVDAYADLYRAASGEPSASE